MFTRRVERMPYYNMRANQSDDKSKIKMIEVPVIVGKGEKQELVVQQTTISPPSPPIFRIKDVDKSVTITNTKLIPIDEDDEPKFCEKTMGKVIINGFIDKNVNYKTIQEFTSTEVNGPVFQFTTRIPFATVVEVKAKEPLKDSDTVEILSAFVEGEKEELLNPNPVAEGAPDWAITFNTLLEKIIIVIKLKVTRTEHVPVKIDC